MKTHMKSVLNCVANHEAFIFKRMQPTNNADDNNNIILLSFIVPSKSDAWLT